MDTQSQQRGRDTWAAATRRETAIEATDRSGERQGSSDDTYREPDPAESSPSGDSVTPALAK